MAQPPLRPQDAVMLIPSLEPDDRLPAYVRRLLDKGFQHVVIVDDGSGAAYQPIFAELDAMDGVSVTHHELNRGKGCALKTGYAYIQAHFPAASGVITADADGQHTVEDCWHLAEVLTEGKRALYLGSRNFNLDHVPPKSRHGNKITSAVFRLLYGVYLPDTQTGLRAFRMADLPFMLDVPGERFEYEMQVLIACARAKLPMIPIEIETVYENENAGTHFHPIRDSYRIYKVILGNFLLYASSSVICFWWTTAWRTCCDSRCCPAGAEGRHGDSDFRLSGAAGVFAAELRSQSEFRVQIQAGHGQNGAQIRPALHRHHYAVQPWRLAAGSPAYFHRRFRVHPENFDGHAAVSGELPYPEQVDFRQIREQSGGITCAGTGRIFC